MNFSGAKSQVIAPERGSFPLDHGARARALPIRAASRS
jgi:hypothetical protein